MPRCRPFTFIHCSDLHLGSPFEALERTAPAVANALREATFAAFEGVVDLAVAEDAAALVVAGDAFDGAEPSLAVRIRLRDALARAAGAGVRCFIACGNHDPLPAWEAGLTLPDGVHLFAADGVQRVTVERDGEPLLEVVGLSHASPDVRENLAARLAASLPDPGAAGTGPPFRLAVLHADVGGQPGHGSYAPCSLADLAGADFDYWALGHIHRPGVLRAERPWAVYSGTPQGRSPRETGPHGCTRVRVGTDGRPRPEAVATDRVRWTRMEVDAAGLADLDALLARLTAAREDARRQAGDRGTLLLLTLTGRTELHRELARLDPRRDLAAPLSQGEEERRDFVWVETVTPATRPPVDLEALRRREDFLGDFLRAAGDLRREPEAAVREVLAALPEAALVAPELVALGGEELLALVDDAEVLGLDLLLAGEA